MSEVHPKAEEISEKVRNILSEFPLHRPEHQVNVRITGGDIILLNYRTTKQNIPFGSTHFDIQIYSNTCFLLEIELEEKERGKDLGKKLYKTVEEIARSLDCKRVVMCPSGKTITGKSRRDYVKDLGYHDLNLIEVEKIL